jgi:3-oxoacyl-[acyl-carrier-protein] synthase II
VIRALRAALDEAGVTPSDITHINAHATSTPVGDAAEALAIREVFGSAADDVVVSAPKSAFGHLLGAAGAVEAIATLLAVNEHVVPPTLNLEDKDDDIELDVVTVDPRSLRPGPAVSNSFGFGGHNVVLVVKPA